VPDTAEDGDRSMLVLLKTPPSRLPRARPGHRRLLDGRREAAPTQDPRYRPTIPYEDVRDLTQLRQTLLDEIEHFFDVYKMLEPVRTAQRGGSKGRTPRSRDAAARGASRLSY
jgi:hypothetical protein